MPSTIWFCSGRWLACSRPAGVMNSFVPFSRAIGLHSLCQFVSMTRRLFFVQMVHCVGLLGYGSAVDGVYPEDSFMYMCAYLFQLYNLLLCLHVSSFESVMNRMNSC